MFKISNVILLTCFAIISATQVNYDFFGVTFVEPGIFPSSGTQFNCQVLTLQRNLTYDFERNITETRTYNTNSPYSFRMNVTTPDIPFSIINTNASTAEFSLIDNKSVNKSEYSFLITSTTLYLTKIENGENHLQNASYRGLLPTNSEKTFRFYFENPYTLLLFNKTQFLMSVELQSHYKNYDIYINSSAGANLYYRFNETIAYKERYVFDQINTYCSNTTSEDDNVHNNNQTSHNTTIFTTLVDSAYSINRTMGQDWFNFQYYTDWEDVTKEFLLEWKSDIQENYKKAKSINEQIMSEYKLNTYEIMYKSAYLKKDTFMYNRKVYFKLIKGLDKMINKFNN